MGKRTSTGNDEALEILSGTFTATGQSGTKVLWGKFNVSLWGTFVGTVQIERSFDGGVTWLPASKDTSGTVASYTAPMTVVCEEPERGVNFRLNCTAFTSGTINYRVSQS